MRLIQTIPAVSEEASGPSYSVVRLCEALIANRNDVTLAALDWNHMPSQPSFIKTFALGLGPRRLGRSPAMRRWLSDAAMTGEVDVIHNHSLWMMPNVYPGWIAKRYGIPLMVSPRGTLSRWAMRSGSSIKRMFWPLVQRPAITATACFHATAQHECEDIRRLNFRQPVAVIPNGVDIPDLPPKVQNNSRTLLFLGRIHPIKGLDVLLPAWAAVERRFPEWRLRIVGPDEAGYLLTMRKLAQELRIDRIQFTGGLHGDDKWKAYREADLFVLPSYSENFGVAIAEALAAEIPVIASKGTPWSGLQKHGAGWWVDTGTDSLVACLESALSQPRTTLLQMGLNGRSWMEKEFSWEQLASRMAETYSWLLGRRDKPQWVVAS